ncbi:MAG: hypothetical protein N3E46_10185 [Gemmataceae bacterium]|nr:hypothetical protein [Gemmataceae bacterium]
MTPSGGAQDYLWLAIVGTEGTQTFTADPSGYTHVHTVSTTGSTAATNGSVRVVSRQLNASSQDPGTFTMSASEDWTAVTIAIPPSDTSTPVSLSDSLVPVLGESAGSLVSLSGSDSFSSLLADAALAAVSFSTSDTAGPSLAETIAFLFDRAVSDTLQPQLTEAASSGVSLGASDSLSPSLAESASSLVSTSRSDSFSDLLAETVLSGVSVAASDSVSPSLGEAVALLLGITVADGLQPQLSDAAASGVSLGASDSLSPLLSESLQSLAGVSAADSLQPQLAESLAALVSRAVSDSIEVSESVSVEVLLSLSDSASLSDSSTLLVLLGPVDSIVSLAEQSHIQTSASDELSLSDSIIPLLDEAANISRVLGDELQISIGEELFALVSVSASDVAVSSLIETLLLEQYRRSIQLGVAGANLTLAGRPSIGGTGILAVQGGAYADTNHGALPVPQV